MDYDNLPVGTIIDCVYGLDMGSQYTTISECFGISISNSGYAVVCTKGYNVGDTMVILVSDLEEEPYYKVEEPDMRCCNEKKEES